MIVITEKAKSKILSLMKEQGRPVEGVQLSITGTIPNTEYGLAFIEAGKSDPKDVMIEISDIKVFMEFRNAHFLEDVVVDYISTLQQSGFKVENPKVIMPPPDVPEGTPNLSSSEAKAVKHVLDTEINPAVAGHGGHISMVDVKDHIAYIRLGGGCQGCGMADVTLKQGVIVAIKKAVPEIVEVLDVTDHAGGNNPYFTPGK